ncbi:hypothetical protein MTO96_027324 [Rhipicephalus appendiculatus]
MSSLSTTPFVSRPFRKLLPRGPPGETSTTLATQAVCARLRLLCVRKESASHRWHAPLVLRAKSSAAHNVKRQRIAAPQSRERVGASGNERGKASQLEGDDRLARPQEQRREKVT